MAALPPEVEHIAIQRSDGGVTIMQFVTKQQRHENDPGWERKPTKANIDKEIERAKLDCVSWKIIDHAAIPTDRTFRDAWTFDKEVTVDMGKARDIHRERLRTQRLPFLQQLDTEFMRAVEAGDKAAQADIARRKQLLRDVTDDPAIEKAATPEELAAVIPSILTPAR